MQALRGYVSAAIAALLALGFFTFYAHADGINGTDVIVPTLAGIAVVRTS